MGKSILGCTKNDFLLDPRTPEGEQYYAENPNLLYLIRQSYGGKYPNNDEGTGDTPWTTMPNCVAYAWARCMEIWVPLIAQCPEYRDQTHLDVFNNGQPFYSGLDYLRKVYDVDRLAQGNGEDTITRLYPRVQDAHKHFDYTIPWMVNEQTCTHAGRKWINFAELQKITDIDATLDYGGYRKYIDWNDHTRAENASEFVPTIIASLDAANYYTWEESITNNEKTVLVHHDGLQLNYMWAYDYNDPAIEYSVPIHGWPEGSILVFGSGPLGEGREGHIMVIESSETQEMPQSIAKLVLPTISDANIPHGNWGRTVKYYNWLNYAGGNNNPIYDKAYHAVRRNSFDYCLGLILPPVEIRKYATSTSQHRRRFAKENLTSPKTLRRLHAGYQDYTPE